MVQPAPPPVIVQPSPSVVVRSAQVVQADEIEATDVRAQTIYANRIEAADVRGALHQTDKIELGDAEGEIGTTSILASVIYADTIKARTVTADNIYVRELERK